MDIFLQQYCSPSVIWVPCVPDYSAGSFVPVYNLSNLPQNLKEKVSELPRGGIKSKPWSHEEDDQMKELIIKYGVKKWTLVANKLNSLFKSDRKGKNCRERWNNHLNPDINKGEWSYEEDIILLKMHKDLGKKWSVISKDLHGRTENSVKNRWNTLMKSSMTALGNTDSVVASEYLIEHLNKLIAKGKSE